MNTHILIPIKDISIEKLKDEFLALEKGKNEFEIIENLAKRERILGKMELLTLGKQISLDEKDIEIKSEKVAMDSFKLQLTPIDVYREIIHQRLGFKEGYLQALKDLL